LNWGCKNIILHTEYPLDSTNILVLTYMENNKIILRLEDFSYLNKKEFLRAETRFPSLSRLGFVSPHHEFTLTSLLNSKPAESEAYDQRIRDRHLFVWDIALSNKIGKLRFSFLNAFTYYERMNGDNSKIDNSDPNRLLFDLYTEVFYNMFFSVNDLLAQIMNVYFKFGVPEDKVKWQKEFKAFFGKDERSKKILEYEERFCKETKEAREIRNAFTHRFPPNQPFDQFDLESALREGLQTGILTDSPTDSSWPPDKMIINMEDSANKLCEFLAYLKSELSK